MVLKLFRESLCSSITGGFYFDRTQSHFLNLIHFYIWITFFMSPLVVHLLTTDSIVPGLAYSISTVFVVASIKYTIWKLHRILDTKTPLSPATTDAFPPLLSQDGMRQEPCHYNLSIEECPKDPERSSEISSRDIEIEDRCRRVGLAGLDMADLMTALQSGSSGPAPRSPNLACPPAPSGNSHIASTSVGREDQSTVFSPLFSGGLNESRLKPGASNHLSESKFSNPIQAFSKPHDDKQRNPENGLGANVSVLDPVSTRVSVHSFEGNRTRDTTLDVPVMPSSSHEAHCSTSPLLRSATGSNLTINLASKPYRRQSCRFPSKTSHPSNYKPIPCSYPMESDPSHSIGDDVDSRARSVQQMNLDINKFPSPPKSKLPSSAIPGTPIPYSRPRSGTSLRSQLRANSQRYHRTYCTADSRVARRQMSAVTYLPSTLFRRQLYSPFDFTDFDLQDAIRFWRQNFVGHKSSNRTVYIRSRRPPLHHTLSFDLPDNVRHSHREWRSRSLRQAFFNLHHPSGRHHALRRPGSSLRLERQHSTGPHSSNNVTRLSSDTHSQTELTPTTIESDITPSTASRVSTDADREQPCNCAEVGVSRDPRTFLKRDDTPTTSSALQHSFDDSQATRRPLVRQRGIRRRSTFYSHFTEQSPSCTLALPSPRLPANPITDQKSRIDLEVTSVNATTAVYSSPANSFPLGSKPAVATSCSEASTSHTPQVRMERKNVDALLAELMGVSSLADAGLTREKCLAQLRCSGDEVDADIAELEILFAVTSATNVDDSNPMEPPEPTSSPVALPNANSSILPISIESNAGAERVTRFSSAQFSEPCEAGPEPSSQTRHLARRALLLRKTKPSPRVPTQTYQIKVLPFAPFTFHIRISRLQLNSLFDNSSALEAALCITLSFLVSASGYLLLRTGSFQNLSVLVCCFSIAGCHYSLIKSVQPDAASPLHGFNRIIVFSRASCFCGLATLYLLTATLSPTYVQSVEQPDLRPFNVNYGELGLISDHIFSSSSDDLLLPALGTIPIILPITHRLGRVLPPSQSSIENDAFSSAEHETYSVLLFGSSWSMKRLLSLVRSTTFCLLLVYPLLFPLGLIPQFDTALTYVLEQVDIHVFGGSGSVGLVSALLSVFRDAFAMFAAFWFCYTALKIENPRHFWCSVFWSMYVPSCFLLSRLPSDFHLYTLLFPSRDQCVHWLSRVRCVLLRFFQSCISLLASKKLGHYRFHESHAVSRGILSTERNLVEKPAEQLAWWRYWLPFLPETNKHITRRTHPIVADPIVSACVDRASFSRADASVLAGRKCMSSPALLCGLLDLTKTFGGIKSIPRAASVTDFTRNLEFISLKTLQASNALNSKPFSSSAAKNVEIQPDSPNGAHSAKRLCAQEFRPRVFGFHEVQLPRDSVQVVPQNDEVNTQAVHQFASSNFTHDSRNCVTQSTPNGSELNTAVKKHAIPHHKSDPLPTVLRNALLCRLENDLLCCCASGLAIFAFHSSPMIALAIGQPYICRILIWTAVLCGAFLHYVVPNLRKSYPWLCLGHPAITTDPRGELVKWETGYYWFCWVERNILLPVITVVTGTNAMASLRSKFGLYWATVLVLITSMKMLRNGFSTAGRVFLTLFFSELVFTFDLSYASEAFPLNYFLISILVPKFIELVRKLHFVYIYTAPFRITWGSVAHALVQIASIPHMLFVLGNCFLSTLLSSPLEPLLASAVFITSYARPIKFWEVTHQTERMETTNTALATQLHGLSEKHVMLNLNAIFYERLTRSLQLALAGDIQLGRLGGLTVCHGDIFILGSEDLNFVVHIIEVGNGFVSFQLRGLEFMGTYCHEHETEALRSSTHNDNGCCCCNPGHLPGMLSLNAALLMRCITWQFVTTSYTIEGYRMTNHGADTIVRLNDLRRILVNRFIQCIIYYVSLLPELPKRLEHLTPYLQSSNFFDESHFDLDPVFLKSIDEDFDEQLNGVTKRRFVQVYSSWIRYCVSKKDEYQYTVSCDPESPMVTLCYALSLLGRRCMAGTQVANYDVDQVLRGIHDVFKGDIKVMTKDEWVLVDLDLLRSVVTPAMRIALKLYQDYFLWASNFAHNALYRKIVHTECNFVICHETDPTWRFAILNDAPSLFSIRWIGANTDDMYRFIQLTKSKLQFCAVKINPECVRGLWAGQQREQIFVRNTNPERGSIQGAQHVLRNLVNSSCDPPIGYPIYVSPILTSFTGTNTQLIQVAGPELSFSNTFRFIRSTFLRIYSRISRGRHQRPPSSNSKDAIELSSRGHLGSQKNIHRSPKVRCNTGSDHLYPPLTSDFDAEHWPVFTGSSESVRLEIENCHHSAHLTTLSALVHDHGDSGVPVRDVVSAPSVRRVRIVDPKQILNSHVNKLTWPSDEWRSNCLLQSACISSVFPGLEGQCLHRWTPCNPTPLARSFCHRTIALVAFPGGPPLLDGHYVAIWEDEGLQDAVQTEDYAQLPQSIRDSFSLNEAPSEYLSLNSHSPAPSPVPFGS